MAVTPDPNALNKGDEIPDDCEFVGNLPFGRLKANDAGNLDTDYGKSPDPAAESEKQQQVDEHEDEGIFFCGVDEPETDGFEFMVKDQPIRAKVGGQGGFGVRYIERLFANEELSVYCAVCSISNAEKDLILTPEDVAHDNPLVNLLLTQTTPTAPGGWEHFWAPWDLDVNTGLAHLGPDDGSAYAIFGEWNMILNTYWFNGLSERRYNTFATRFVDWISRTNSTGSCSSCEVTNGAHQIGGGRCLRTHMNSSVNHCNEDFDSSTCQSPKFPVACLSDSPFRPPGDPPSFTPFSLTFEIEFVGFTHNGVLLEWDHPKSGIPQDVWFPEG